MSEKRGANNIQEPQNLPPSVVVGGAADYQNKNSSRVGERDAMNTVVYYPYVTPRPEWLRLAALCWDEVYRMVPQNQGNVAPSIWHHPREIEMLSEALGLPVRDLSITEVADSAGLLGQFKRWIDARAERLKSGKWTSEVPKKSEPKLFPRCVMRRCLQTSFGSYRSVV